MIDTKEKHKQVNSQTTADKKPNNVVKLCANYEITHHFKTNLWLENSTYFPANLQGSAKNVVTNVNYLSQRLQPLQ